MTVQATTAPAPMTDRIRKVTKPLRAPVVSALAAVSSIDLRHLRGEPYLKSLIDQSRQILGDLDDELRR